MCSLELRRAEAGQDQGPCARSKVCKAERTTEQNRGYACETEHAKQGRSKADIQVEQNTEHAAKHRKTEYVPEQSKNRMHE